MVEILVLLPVLGELLLVIVGMEVLGIVQLLVLQLLAKSELPEAHGTMAQLLVMVERDIVGAAIFACKLPVVMQMAATQVIITIQ